MKIQKFSGLATWTMVFMLLISAAGCAEVNDQGPYLPTIIYTDSVTETPTVTAVEMTPTPYIVAPETQQVSFFEPFEQILQAVIISDVQTVEVVPSGTPVLPVELAAVIEPFPTETLFAPTPTPTSTYVYPDGVQPLVINPDGSVEMVVVTAQVEKPPCDMNPLTYGLANGMDALYDLAETRDGKICMYVVAPFCSPNMQMPYADWRTSQLAAAQLPDEGNDKDIVMYGSNIQYIASLLGTSTDIAPDARIFIVEDDLWNLKFTLLMNMCSDPEGRPVLGSYGIQQMLDFLKSRVQ